VVDISMDDGLDDGVVTCVANRPSLLRLLPSRAKSNTLPCLVVITGGMVGRMVRIDGQLAVGRAPGVDLRLDEEGVSRRHATIVVRPDGAVELEDLASRNGTFVNGERVETRLLTEGDLIAIGPGTVLKFSYRDAAEEQLQRTLYASATSDALTGVHNRRWFDETLAAELARAWRHNRPLSLLIVDVDHFKKVNDRYGHPAGDAVLRAIGACLTEVIGREDAVARYGGEEFAILLRDTTSEAARGYGESVRRAIEATTVHHHETAIAITASVGIGTVRGECALSVKTLVEAADRCLYLAKERGRNRVEG